RREEHAAADEHRQHDEVDEAAHRLRVPGARSDEEPETAECESAEQRQAYQERQRSGDWNPERKPSEEQQERQLDEEERRPHQHEGPKKLRAAHRRRDQTLEEL